MLNSVKKKKRNSEKGKKVRYAVVGLGYIAQNACYRPSPMPAILN